MYPEYLQASLKKVAEKRDYNTALQPERMSAEDKKVLLEQFHPDYRKDQFEELKVGQNKGESVNVELAQTLQGHARLSADDVDLEHPD